MENQNSENINEEVTTAPVNEEKDLGDKTIDAVENIMITKDHSKDFNKEDVEKNKCYFMLFTSHTFLFCYYWKI